MTRGNRRNLILATASRLFAAKGFARTTVSEIAREAEVAEGTLYHHFGSKDDLFLTLFDEMVDDYLSLAERAVREGSTGLESLRALIRFHFEFVGSNAERFLLVLRDFPSHMLTDSRSRAAVSRRKLDRVSELFSAILERGASDGSIVLPVPAGDGGMVLRGLLYGVTRHKMLGLTDSPLPRLAAMVETFFLAALRVRERPAEIPSGPVR